MTSPSEAILVGGPLDGAVYERRGAAFPPQVRMPVEKQLHLYRVRVAMQRGKPVVRYVHYGWTMAGSEVIS